MKKISILTFFKNEENYGAILQALALNSVLSQYCTDVEVALFCSIRSEPPIAKRIRSRVWNSIRLVLGVKKRIKRTLSFEKGYINQSINLVTVEDLHSYLASRDICVVGSDQVWNPQLFPKGKNPFLLDGIEGFKKVAYAASFGIASLPQEETTAYERALRSFSAISVREKAGQKIINSIGLDAIVTLDPTLLLTTMDWNKRESKGHIGVKKPYVLCYVMPGKSEVRTLYCVAKRIAQERNLQVVYLGDREYMRFWGKNLDAAAGPAEFLEYFHNAEFVVTNSFHGTCFSVNYEKDFISILGEERESFGMNRNSRIEGILEKLNLTKRIIYSSDSEIKDVGKINWAEVRSILDVERKHSLAFIKENILDNLH